MSQDIRAREATNCRGLDPACMRAMQRARTADMKLASIIVLCLCAFVVPTLLSQEPVDEETAWVCPMHADYTMDAAGKCPRCGMDLVRAAPFDVRDYQLEFRTIPAVAKPGQKTKLLFRIFHPGNGEPI